MVWGAASCCRHTFALLIKLPHRKIIPFTCGNWATQNELSLSKDRRQLEAALKFGARLSMKGWEPPASFPVLSQAIYPVGRRWLPITTVLRLPWRLRWAGGQLRAHRGQADSLLLSHRSGGFGGRWGEPPFGKLRTSYTVGSLIRVQCERSYVVLSQSLKGPPKLS